MIYIHNLQSLKSYSLILFSILFLIVFACVISPLKTENSISLPPLDWSLCLLPLCSESFFSLQTTNVIKARGDTKATGVSYRLKHEASQHLFEVTQTMQVPISYAEEIIGIGGNNIAYIRRTSGAIITVQESRGYPDEITVEIRGTSSQVQMAQQLIQEFLSNHREPVSSSYSMYEPGLRSVYSQMDSTRYSSSSLSGQSYGGYGSSGLGGYSSFRL